ncbi:MAG TPA: hypothetical protein VL025_09610 [Thermoanaerobaculia bacterium]|nr:hypothetical protein [Thermoanaerobaculia bacterium]
MRRTLILAAVAAVLAAPLAAVDPDLLAGLKARSIGPAAMSGRIAAIEASPANPDVVYVGAATGGVWKSVNGGLTWDPVFDDQPVAAIGAIAIDPSNPDVVWVGTGEGNPRNSVSVGDGVYKSNDGGRTWQRAGLEKTERIHRILLDPRNPRVAYAAALGQAWGENPERGVFKTEDGGKTWRRVLYVDERTGAADLVIDPENPNKLFAAMWDYRRWPWSFRSGGPGSGLYVSHDAGETWRRLTEDNGLPKGTLGRIGLAIAPSDPRIVYALVEAEESALARSEDGGRTWRLVNTETDVNPRPFYYADLRVDPGNANRVYRLASRLDVSNDGGKTFETLAGFRAVHPDHHAMWIDPNDGRRMMNGNDGGVYLSGDRGRTWSFVANLPVPQFYHVRVDNAVPYNVYGGLQDNGSWKGPGTVWENGGIRNHHWQEVQFGDGFDTVPDPRDPMRGYAMSQEGYLSRYDLKTGERKDIRPATPTPGTPLRFNWNAGIAIDPFAPDTIYYGSQLVHKSTDRGDTWTAISSDLTTNRAEWQKQDESGGLTPDVSGAENFTTIITIAPSPKQQGVLWVGTDDGRLHVTQDGGQTWTSVEGNLRGVPANTWIPHVEPSPHDAGTAFVVFDDHRRSNWTPYVQKTTDFGKTWTSLATRNLRGYALSIVQDPVDPDLLFLGTEFGLWASLDGGKGWMPWRHGVPTVSVMDLVIHPREQDLVIATHGRGIYILDDIRPLRSVSDDTQKKPVHVYETSDARQYRVAQTGGARFPGNGEFRGENQPYGALLTYSLNAPGLPHPDEEKERERKEAERAKTRTETAADAPKPTPAELEAAQRTSEGKVAPKPPAEGEDEGRRGRRPEAEIQILDGEGKVIRTFKQPAVQGLNRAAWDLKTDAFKRAPSRRAAAAADEPWRQQGGPEVLPGTYKVRVKYGQQQGEGTVRVVADPRFHANDGARKANFDAQQRAGALQDTAVAALERIVKARQDLDTITAQLRKQDEDAKKAGGTDAASPNKDLLAGARKLQKSLNDLEGRLRQPENPEGILPDLDVLSKINYAQRSLSSSWDAPTQAQLAYLGEAEQLLRTVLTDLNRFFAEDVAAFRAKVKESDLRLLGEGPPIEVR